MNEEFLYWCHTREEKERATDLEIFQAGAAAMREKAAEVAEKKAGWPPETPITCCQEDYENHYIAKDIADAIRKLEV